MATINGTNKADRLVGTAGDDVINGRNGNDQIDGGAGNDTLAGGNGRDIFILQDGGGNDVISDFEVGQDKVYFSFNGSSDILFLGGVFDGKSFTDFNGDSYLFQAVDADGDGITDTLVTVNGDESITLLGVAPNSLHGADFFGG